MHSNYINPAIRQLRDQQVRFAPREKKIEQVDRAEMLLGELQKKRIYTYEYLCFRITSYRPESYPDMRLSGSEASHDIRLFVEDVSDSANVVAESAGERVLTLPEMAGKFNVSIKTIARWRQQGLVSRRFVFDGRKRVGFLTSSIERFVRENEGRVSRGARFSQLSDEQRREIVEKARRLAHAGGCPAEIGKRLARQTGRSPETIRYTLRQFDMDHPDLAVFPGYSGTLTDATKRKIYQQNRRGESAEELAKRFFRTKTSVYRIIGEMRARRIMELPLDYMPNRSFGRVRTPGEEGEFLAPMPMAEQKQRKSRAPAGLPPYLASLYEVPLLTSEQERHLFRKMNYLKYRARELRDELNVSHPRVALMERIETLYEEGVATKNEIVSANLRLVVSIAKRHVAPTENFFELVSDGNISLLRAVEKFDYALGNKFSTYATWAITKNFARSIPHEHRHHDRFRTSHSEMFGTTQDGRGDQYAEETAQLQREEQVQRILDRLDDRERQIIANRFGLIRGREPLTLKEVGDVLGVSKERIRQLEVRALGKLREAVKEEKIDIPGLD